MSVLLFWGMDGYARRDRALHGDGAEPGAEVKIVLDHSRGYPCMPHL